MRQFELTLELSLKPFKAEIDEEAVITELLLQYADLIRASSNLSFQFWTSDGSEILSYSGDIDSSFEWACYIGNANATGAVPQRSSLSRSTFSLISLHWNSSYLDLFITW
jgi:hypothetical protein